MERIKKYLRHFFLIDLYREYLGRSRSVPVVSYDSRVVDHKDGRTSIFYSKVQK
jgi:hypothetical protein